MKVFVDTSALLAVLNAEDAHHPTAAAAWRRAIEEEVELVTHDYVVVELLAIVGRRFGFEAVQRVSDSLLPALRLVCVDAPVFEQALAALLTAARRRLSLVDCASFVLMRREGLETAFAFDRHFPERGFAPFA
jgi:predicted nucleic acid-binding protein